jgi:hypothetical protein
MRKYGLFTILVTLALLAAVVSGCDNRSQLEKSADNAAKKVNNMLK